MVNLWNAQFYKWENKEDLDALISSVSKLILIKEITFKKRTKGDSPTKINATHRNLNRPNKIK